MEKDGTFENTKNLQSLEIYALSGCNEKLDWGEGRKLVENYDKKGKLFKQQCDAFQEQFKGHCDSYKFGFY